MADQKYCPALHNGDKVKRDESPDPISEQQPPPTPTLPSAATPVDQDELKPSKSEQASAPLPVLPSVDASVDADEPKQPTPEQAMALLLHLAVRELATVWPLPSVAKNVHSLPAAHVCKLCGKSYSSGQALGGHMRVHWDGASQEGKKKEKKLPNPGLDAGPPQSQELVINLGGFVGSTSNIGIDLPDPNSIRSNRVSNGYRVPKPISRKRSSDARDAQDTHHRSNQVQGGENGSGSNSDMRLKRSKSRSREGDINAFRGNRPHGSDGYQDQRDATATNTRGAVGLHCGYIRSHDEEAEHGHNPSNEHVVDAELRLGCPLLVVDDDDDVDTKLRMWWVFDKEPRKDDGPQRRE